MRRRTSFFFMFVLVGGCSGSGSGVSPGKPSSVTGTWGVVDTTTQMVGAQQNSDKKERYMSFAADGTHRSAGRQTIVSGNTSTVVQLPCARGTYTFANDRVVGHVATTTFPPAFAPVGTQPITSNKDFLLKFEVLDATSARFSNEDGSPPPSSIAAPHRHLPLRDDARTRSSRARR